MHELIAWCGFVGGWLLVAGPLFQAAIELEEESLDREAFAERFAQVRAPKRVSPWWWLLPPVAYVLNRRNGRAHRDELMRTMSREEAEQVVRFSGKATGWAFVAGGAGLIAVKETWELAETYAWPEVVFWLLIPVMLVAVALNTVLRVKRGHDIVGLSHPSEETP